MDEAVELGPDVKWNTAHILHMYYINYNIITQIQCIGRIDEIDKYIPNE